MAALVAAADSSTSRHSSREEFHDSTVDSNVELKALAAQKSVSIVETVLGLVNIAVTIAAQGDAMSPLSPLQSAAAAALFETFNVINKPEWTSEEKSGTASEQTKVTDTGLELDGTDSNKSVAQKRMLGEQPVVAFENFAPESAVQEDIPSPSSALIINKTEVTSEFAGTVGNASSAENLKGSVKEGEGFADEILEVEGSVFPIEPANIIDGTEIDVAKESEEFLVITQGNASNAIPNGDFSPAKDSDEDVTGYGVKSVSADSKVASNSKVEVLVIEKDREAVAKIESEAKNKVSAIQNAAIVINVTDNADSASQDTFAVTGLNHVAFCVENLERSLEFYCGLLGLKNNPSRPQLPYKGVWLDAGAEGIHLMEVPNPDPPAQGRPGHGGFDRHACLACRNVEGVRRTLQNAGIGYQYSLVPSVFARDPDGNGLEFIEIVD